MKLSTPMGTPPAPKVLASLGLLAIAAFPLAPLYFSDARANSGLHSIESLPSLHAVIPRGDTNLESHEVVPRDDEEGLALMSLDAHLAAGEEAFESNPEKALTHFEWALRMQPRNPSVSEWLSKAYESPESVPSTDKSLYYALRARDFWIASGEEKKDLAKALSLIDKRISSIAPEGGEILTALDQYIDDLKSIGSKHFSKKFYRTASDLYGIVLSLSPNDKDATKKVEEIQKKSATSRASAALAAKLKRTRSPEWIANQDRAHRTWSKAFSKKLKNYQLKTNAGYEIYQTAAAILDPINRFYREVYRRQKDTSIVHILIYGTRQDYVDSMGGSVPAGVRGHFSSDGQIVTYDPRSENLPVDGMWRTMFHELSHQFLRTVTRGNSDLPLWINEGLACYFEGCQIQDDGTIETNRIPAVRIRPLIMAIRRGSPGLPHIALRDLLMAKKERFDANHYNHAWGLAYFFRNAEDENGDNIYHDAIESLIKSYEKGGQEDPIQRFEEQFIKKVKRPEITSLETFEKMWLAWLDDVFTQYLLGSKAAPELAKKGAWYLEKKKLSKAEETFLKALEYAPNDVQTRLSLSDTYLAQDDNDEALHHLRRALKSVGELNEGDSSPESIQKRIDAIDPLADDFREATQAFTDAMHAKASIFEASARPLCSLYTLDRLASIAGRNKTIQEKMKAVQESSGQSMSHWRWIFNGVDLDGWSESEGFDASDLGVNAASDDFPMQTLYNEFFGERFKLRTRVRLDPSVPSAFGFALGVGGDGPQRFFMITSTGAVLLAHLDEVTESPEFDARSLTKTPLKDGELLKLEVDGSTIRVFFEDRLIIDHTFEDEGLSNGQIGLRIEMGEVRFEELEVLTD